MLVSLASQLTVFLCSSKLEAAMAEQVFAVPELLELIIKELPIKDIVKAQRVSTFWKQLIESSHRIQRSLFRASGKACDTTVEHDKIEPYITDDCDLPLLETAKRIGCEVFALHPVASWHEYKFDAVRAQQWISASNSLTRTYISQPTAFSGLLEVEIWSMGPEIDLSPARKTDLCACDANETFGSLLEKIQSETESHTWRVESCDFEFVWKDHID